MAFKFCPHCARQLELQSSGTGERLYCGQCDKIQYRNPTVGVAVVLVEDNRLLLVRRLGSYAGMWCIPCGHVERGEDVRQAASREFEEETGLKVTVGPVFAVHSNFHDTANPTVGIWFWGQQAGGRLCAGSDADEVKWFAIEHLPDRLAFPTDVLVCEKLKRCLRSGDVEQYLASSWAKD